MGRARGPVQQHGLGHPGPAAAQARRPAAIETVIGSGYRLRARTAVRRAPGRRRPIRLRLTLTYSGLFVLAGAALLAVTYLLVGTRGYQPPGGVEDAVRAAA